MASKLLRCLLSRHNLCEGDPIAHLGGIACRIDEASLLDIAAR